MIALSTPPQLVCSKLPNKAAAIACILFYRLNLQMETVKKAYHTACKEEKLAASRETNSKLENNNNPDAQKKLQEKVDKCQQEVQKVGLPLEKG